MNHEINIFAAHRKYKSEHEFFSYVSEIEFFCFLYFLGKVFDHVDDSGDAVFSGLGNLSSNMTDDADESG